MTGNVRILLGLFAALALLACGADEGGDLAVQIYFTPGPGAAPSELRGDPPADISDFRLCVTARDMGSRRCANFSVADYQKSGRSRLSDIPTGEERKVSFQGFQYTRQEASWCGETSGVTIRKNQTTKVSLFISGCSDFTATRNSMSSPRVFHTATRLRDGRVLIAGGFKSMSGTPELCTAGGTQFSCLRLHATDQLDVYDPSRGEFQPLTGSHLLHPRGLHSASLLPDGRILLVGGGERAVLRLSFPAGPAPVILIDPQDQGLGDGWGLAGASAEIIDPVTFSSSELPLAGVTPRAGHVPLAVPGGQVLLVGGTGPGDPPAELSTAIRFDPLSMAFSEIAALNVARQGTALVGFGDPAAGQYLFWGGNHAAGPQNPGLFAEILTVSSGSDPAARAPAFTTTQISRGWPGFYGAAAEVPTVAGAPRVLVTGGMVVDKSFSNQDLPFTLNQFRLIDLAAGSETMQENQNFMSRFRAFHTATTLSSVLTKQDEVMVAGGFISYDSVNGYKTQNWVEFFSPGTMAFTSKQVGARTVTLLIARAGHTATLLGDCTVLFAGGFTGDPPLTALSITDSAEVFNPTSRSLDHLPIAGDCR